MSSPNNKQKSVWLSKPMISGYILTLIVVGFWTIWFLQSPSCVNSPCENNWNLFWSLDPNEVGDTFAGLFGSLAFVWIVVTVFLQGNELRDQRKEFTLMNKTMESQLFEVTFFELISTHNSIVDGLDVTYTDHINWDAESVQITKKGRDSFEYYIKMLKFYNKPEYDIDDWYGEFWVKCQNDLGHYFRFLYRSFKFISETEHAQEYHHKLFRALLSDAELVVLFYNCVSIYGEKFRKYAVEFELFDNLHPSALLEYSDWSLIDKSAFGEQAESLAL